MTNVPFLRRKKKKNFAKILSNLQFQILMLKSHQRFKVCLLDFWLLHSLLPLSTSVTRIFYTLIHLQLYNTNIICWYFKGRYRTFSRERPKRDLKETLARIMNIESSRQNDSWLQMELKESQCVSVRLSDTKGSFFIFLGKKCKYSKCID